MEYGIAIVERIVEKLKLNCPVGFFNLRCERGIYHFHTSDQRNPHSHLRSKESTGKSLRQRMSFVFKSQSIPLCSLYKTLADI